MNKKFYVSLGLVLLTFLLISTPVQAQKKPIQLALFTPIQIFPENQHIAGIRFNLIYGRNASVTGLDLGFINQTTKGLSKGFQWGFIGLADSDFLGWQNNSLNFTKGNFEGLQTGFFNYANKMNGIQFGLVNYAVNMEGLQIGLVNIIKQGGQFPVFPIVNWSF